MEAAIKAVKEPKTPKSPKTKKVKTPDAIYETLKAAVKEYKPTASKKKIKKILKKASKFFTGSKKEKKSAK